MPTTFEASTQHDQRDGYLGSVVIDVLGVSKHVMVVDHRSSYLRTGEYIGVRCPSHGHTQACFSLEDALLDAEKSEDWCPSCRAEAAAVMERRSRGDRFEHIYETLAGSNYYERLAHAALNPQPQVTIASQDAERLAQHYEVSAIGFQADSPSPAEFNPIWINQRTTDFGPRQTNRIEREGPGVPSIPLPSSTSLSPPVPVAPKEAPDRFHRPSLLDEDEVKPKEPPGPRPALTDPTSFRIKSHEDLQRAIYRHDPLIYKGREGFLLRVSITIEGKAIRWEADFRNVVGVRVENWTESGFHPDYPQYFHTTRFEREPLV